MIFDYCIWLTTQNINEWHEITDEFLPHMSIKTHFLTLKKAQKYVKSMEKNFPIILELEYMKTTQTKGFHALVGNVIYSNKNKFQKPIWWPNDAHISLLYKYYDPITEKEIKDMWKKITIRECAFDEIKIMRCNDHHTTWEEFPICGKLKKRH